MREYILLYNEIYDDYYIGQEDIRLYLNDSNQLLYNTAIIRIY